MRDVTSSSIEHTAEQPSVVPLRFYTVEQVAAMLLLSRYRVYEIIRLRLLPAVHIGRQVRIEESALMQWARATPTDSCFRCGAGWSQSFVKEGRGMSGQIIKRGERTWLLRIYLGEDPVTNKLCYKNHTVHGTKKEAQALLDARLRERDMGQLHETSKITFGAYMERWLDRAAKAKLRERTLNDYTDVIRLYLALALGFLRLARSRRCVTPLSPHANTTTWSALRNRLETPVAPEIDAPPTTTSRLSCMVEGATAPSQARRTREPRRGALSRHPVLRGELRVSRTGKEYYHPTSPRDVVRIVNRIGAGDVGRAERPVCDGGTLQLLQKTCDRRGCR